MCSPKGKSRAKRTGHDPAEKGGKGGSGRLAHSRPWRACGDDLHIRVKDTLVQPQSEREAVLTGREPSQAMGAICENRRG